MLTGRLENGETIAIDGPYPAYASYLGTSPLYRDSAGTWYTGKLTSRGYRRHVKLTPLTGEQLAKLQGWTSKKD